MKSKFYIYRAENVAIVKGTNIMLNKKYASFLHNYIKNLDRDTYLGKTLSALVSRYNENAYIFVYSIIFHLNSHSFASLDNVYPGMIGNKEFLLKLIDNIYDYYRSSIRFMIADKQQYSPQKTISIMNHFSDVIIHLYRRVYERILKNNQQIYRELASGLNGAFVQESTEINALPIELTFLRGIKPITSIIIRPPFIVETSANKREGTFFEKCKNIEAPEFDKSRFYLLPLKIREELVLAYINKQNLSVIPGLGTLFDIADSHYIASHQPTIIVLYGIEKETEPYYYQTSDQTYVGVVSFEEKYDYFGYAKKMILTLFNLAMIDRGHLPIHGAGLNIALRSGVSKNIVILGDSGAGKSETIEAMKHLQDHSIADITTIYDDMGTFIMHDGQVFTQGTETGAFVRLDDLDKAYSLFSMDRAVFYNPDKTNSRVVVPITDFATTNHLSKVDLFLYAVNYETDEKGIQFIKNQEEAENIFIAGQRFAMKTTAEKGMVNTFFANPFGPMQKQEAARPLIHTFFTALYANNIPVGVLYTNLANDKTASLVKAATGLLNSIKES